MRRFSLSVLLVAICLLPVGIGSGTSAHSHAVAALDGALANTASAQAQVLEDYFARARSIESPDTKEWVISNSTLMPTSDGSKQAIVHFEVTIESFRKVAASLTNRFDVLVIDAGTGQVLGTPFLDISSRTTGCHDFWR